MTSLEAIYEDTARRWLSPHTKSTSILILDLLASRTMRNKFFLSNLWQQARMAKTYGFNLCVLKMIMLSTLNIPVKKKGKEIKEKNYFSRPLKKTKFLFLFINIYIIKLIINSSCSKWIVKCANIFHWMFLHIFHSKCIY